VGRRCEPYNFQRLLGGAPLEPWVKLLVNRFKWNRYLGTGLEKKEIAIEEKFELAYKQKDLPPKDWRLCGEGLSLNKTMFHSKHT